MTSTEPLVTRYQEEAVSDTAEEAFSAWIDVINGDMCDVGVYRMEIVGWREATSRYDPPIPEWAMVGGPAVFQAELPYPRDHENHEEIMDAAEDALRCGGWVVTRESDGDEWWEPTDTGYAAVVDRS